ncbi:fibronectin type III domain-containing protein [Pelagicoccus sp. SDUM812005]|uniref:fibronectin type III domain-containing protein n=1 Tax=Pelagicoccus sp. SDUM812005 TaxID=3041257 RepID=UPI00280DFADD|nr:fibronectin type III domain-containing protein [Pelagicoccus sp. SDUM812005]MDQ8182370.1 fibronectin type III domain-containing protein [Pelagicoccus sp. SDUM812005]
MHNVTKFGICLGSLALASVGYGSISFNIAAGTLRDDAGVALNSGLVILAVDTEGDGFDLPNSTSFFPAADDMEVARWNFSEGGGLDGEFLASKLIANYDAANWSAGDRLALFWYPALDTDATQPGTAKFGVFADPRDESTGDAWTMPADNTHLYSLQFFAEGSVLNQSSFASQYVAAATLDENADLGLSDVMPDPSKTSPTSNTIQWDVSSGAQGYSVERREVGSSSWEKLGSVAGGVNSFVDDSLVPGATYQYRVVAENGFGYAVWESLEQLFSERSKIINLAARGFMGDDVDTRRGIGLAVTGTEEMPVLIQAVGPSMPGALPKPIDTLLTLFYGIAPTGVDRQIAQNDDWDVDSTEAAAISAAQSKYGAQALNAGAGDSALLASVGQILGGYTNRVQNPMEGGGVASVQVYDLNYLEDSPADARLTGLASRGLVGTGVETLRGSFNIHGQVPMKVIIRANGPGLRDQVPDDIFTAENTLADPFLQILRWNGSGWDEYGSNDNWETRSDGLTPSEVNDAALSVGLAPFDSGSEDCVVVGDFDPGIYTAIVNGVGDTTGVALIEIYEISPN